MNMQQEIRAEVGMNMQPGDPRGDWDEYAAR